MRLTVLGGCGAWPSADQACSGYLLESDGFTLLIDPGYAVVSRLLRQKSPGQIDAVYVSHRHPDHCADLNPLLRARTMSGDDPPPLTVFAPHAALDAVLALDRPGWLDEALALQEFAPGQNFGIGPYQAETTLLPHAAPNAGVRLTAGHHTLAYTGDTGPSPEITGLARDADLFLAEASHVDDDDMPADLAPVLSTARQAGQNATDAGVAQLLLTHLIPGTDPSAAADVARESYAGPVAVAAPDIVVDLK